MKLNVICGDIAVFATATVFLMPDVEEGLGGFTLRALQYFNSVASSVNGSNKKTEFNPVQEPHRVKHGHISAKKSVMMKRCFCTFNDYRWYIQGL